MHQDSRNHPQLRRDPSQPGAGESAGVDLAELVAGAAQQALSAARNRGVRILFDYRGPAPRALHMADGAAISTLCEHLLAWIIRCPAADCVSFGARAHWLTPSRCGFCLTAANVDLGLHEAGGVRRTSAVHPQASRDSTPTLTLAANVCRSRHGSFELEQLGADRRQARAEFAFDCFERVPEVTARLAPPQDAWLVGSPPRALEAMARRLHRRGWRLRMFEQAGDALREWGDGTQARAPGLVITAEPLGSSREGVVLLRNRLPPTCAVVWLVDINEHRGRSPQAGILVAPMPLAESQLAALARRVDLHPLEAVPATVASSDGDFVLVVDDNAVNRHVATAMLERLGYDSDTAVDGSDAVDRCLTRQPGAVLMDLRMPGMNGYDAARKLRQLQREGIVASFPILAATADVEGLDFLACARAGMDSVLTKPMDLRLLGEHLSTAMAGYATNRS